MVIRIVWLFKLLGNLVYPLGRRLPHSFHVAFESSPISSPLEVLILVLLVPRRRSPVAAVAYPGCG